MDLLSDLTIDFSKKKAKQIDEAFMKNTNRLYRFAIRRKLLRRIARKFCRIEIHEYQDKVIMLKNHKQVFIMLKPLFGSHYHQLEYKYIY
jgi:hypothetical protein